MREDLFGDFSLYIHIPFCKSKCAYCDFLSFADHSAMDAYFEALCAEIKKKGHKYPRKVNNIYIGGGTPSIAFSYFSKLKEAVFSSFDVDPNAEISIECNPESVSREFVFAAKDFGVNRVSVGVQSLSDRLLRRIGRAHDAQTARNALALLTKEFPRVNADVMVGLPEEQEIDVRGTLSELLTYDLSHVSCYSLILERGTRLFCEAKEGLFVPDEDHAVAMYDLACDMLAEKGFSRYEISNFAKEGEACRYNLSVWQYADYLGLGLGASSFIKREVSFFGRRYRAVASMERYISGARAKSERVTLSDGKEEFIMLGLRLAMGLNVRCFNALFDADFLSEYAEKLKKLSAFLNVTDSFVGIKPEHIYISNSIISELI